MSYHTRMVKGQRTELTYKVGMDYDHWWRVDVLEPYLTEQRFFGLVPAKLKYRWVFSPPDDTFMFAPKEHASPAQVQEMAMRAVQMWEEHKLAWEQA